MTDKIKRGREGEKLAASFLQEKGYEIVAHNYRSGRSEIDLIVRMGNWLVFVEVKTRTSTAYGYPEDFVTYKQEQKIFEGALDYMYEIDWRGNVRYDIVAVDLSSGQPDIRHIEDAFY